jgi:hypothetical protein
MVTGAIWSFLFFVGELLCKPARSLRFNFILLQTLTFKKLFSLVAYAIVKTKPVLYTYSKLWFYKD